MRDPSRTDEERTLGLGGEAWLILVDQHRVELRHRSRVSCLDAEGGIETGLSPRAGVREELILITLRVHGHQRSEEHTSELQSLMRISYAVFRLKKKIKNNKLNNYKHRDLQ